MAIKIAGIVLVCILHGQPIYAQGPSEIGTGRMGMQSHDAQSQDGNYDRSAEIQSAVPVYRADPQNSRYPLALTGFRLQDSPGQYADAPAEAMGPSVSQANAAKQMQAGMIEIQNGMGKLTEGLEKVGRSLRITTVDENWKIGIFGSITGEMMFSEQRPIIPSGIVLLSPDFGRDTPTVEIHGKQSSLGAAFVGPDVGGLKAGGLLLTYFYGEDYLADQPGFFIVRGYGELKNDFWRFVVGTEADVINPLKPNMLDFNTGNGAGNMGFFRGQFRVEKYAYFGCNKLTTQFALSNPITTTFDGNARNLVEDSGWPNVDMRVAIGLGQERERYGDKSRQLELGVSGLVGEIRRTGTPVSELEVWAVGADAKIALTDRIGIQGEFFHGQGIGNYNAGIVQIFNPLTLQEIQSTGGWGEIFIHWSDCLHSHFGYGVDDPDDATLSPTLPTRNAFAFANIIWDVTKNLEVGLEVDHWDTDFTAAPALGALEPGDNDAMIYRTRVQFKF